MQNFVPNVQALQYLIILCLLYNLLIKLKSFVMYSNLNIHKICIFISPLLFFIHGQVTEDDNCAVKKGLKC